MSGPNARLARTMDHLRPQAVSAASAPASPDDVVIVAAYRTPMARGRKGSFKDAFTPDMLVPVLKAVCEKSGVDKKVVDDIQVGNVLTPGAGAREAREASFLAGYPVDVSVSAVNRQCSSGLEACARIAAGIKAGFIDAGIGAGVESMTRGYGASAMSEASPLVGDDENAEACSLPMGTTSENVAKKYNVSRADQDKFALSSYEKALAAQAAGKFDGEIVPTKVTIVDKEDNEKEITVTKDEGPRPTTLEKLGKLRPAFADDGCSTAGNSSQVSDGAAAVLLMRRSKAQAIGAPILGRFVGYSVAGVEPQTMGEGPIPAVRKLMKQTGLSVDKVDVFELNEAFASQALATVRELNIDINKVNPNGGAIALGHPLGCTGARQIATLLPELKRSGGQYGVVTMCIGTGMGAAALIQRE